MIKITILACFIACAIGAPPPSVSPESCVKERTDLITKSIPEGYRNQISKLLACKSITFYNECYEKHLGVKIPTDLNSLINMTCYPPEYKRMGGFEQCVSGSAEKIITVFTELGDNLQCQINELGSTKDGTLCGQWKKVGADKAAEFAKAADEWFSQTSRFLSMAVPQDLKSCAAIFPTKSSEMLDAICDPDRRQGRGHKMIKCIQDNTTVRSVIEITRKINPRYG